jgi:hypothetical protein
LDDAAFDGGLCDLHLLVVTGGRERTRSDFERLLHSTGFHVTSVERSDRVPALLVCEAT